MYQSVSCMYHWCFIRVYDYWHSLHSEIWVLSSQLAAVLLGQWCVGARLHQNNKIIVDLHAHNHTQSTSAQEWTSHVSLLSSRSLVVRQFWFLKWVFIHIEVELLLTFFKTFGIGCRCSEIELDQIFFPCHIISSNSKSSNLYYKLLI